MVLYPNKLPESERVCSGICKEENMRLFENVKEDDNLVLVFFKIKDL